MSSKAVYRRFISEEDNAYVAVLSDYEEGSYHDTMLEIHDGRHRIAFSFDMWSGTVDEHIEARYKLFLEQMEAIKFAAISAQDEAAVLFEKASQSEDEDAESETD